MGGALLAIDEPLTLFPDLFSKESYVQTRKQWIFGAGILEILPIILVGLVGRQLSV